MKALVWILAAFLAAVSGIAADSKGKGRGANAHADAPKGRGATRTPEKVFRLEDRTIIVDYYRSLPGGLPPGLAKRGGDLPPGLEKQLRRNGTLPPGLQKRVTPFPAELEMRLPPCPVGVHRGLLGGIAVMWNSKSGLILDAAAVLGL